MFQALPPTVSLPFRQPSNSHFHCEVTPSSQQATLGLLAVADHANEELTASVPLDGAVIGLE